MRTISLVSLLLPFIVAKVAIKQQNRLTIRYVPKSEVKDYGSYSLSRFQLLSSIRFRYQCLYKCQKRGHDACKLPCVDETDGKCYLIKKVVMHEDPVKREKQSDDLICVIQKNDPMLLNLYNTQVTFKSFYPRRYHTMLDHLTWFSTSDRFNPLSHSSYGKNYITVDLGAEFR